MAARKDYEEIKYLRQWIEALNYLIMTEGSPGRVMTKSGVMVVLDAGHLQLVLQAKLRMLEKKA